jgi:P63C domain
MLAPPALQPPCGRFLYAHGRSVRQRELCRPLRKRFPDEFYKEMFRLKGWEWLSICGKRPSVVGTYTNDLVYERLAPGILAELEGRNPKDERGNRRGKHHQLLTDDVGHPALAQHLHAVIGLMRAAGTWDQFYR